MIRGAPGLTRSCPGCPLRTLSDRSTDPTIDDLEMTMKTWNCVVCGFVYDEALGLPDEGIPAGTKWEDVPEDWCCPDCGVAKSDFEMVAL
jgi:rubredoxin